MTLSMPLFILASAGCYSIAMVAMKFWGQGVTPLIVAVTVAAVIVGVGLEIEALRTERLGLIYVGILGAECIMIAVASWWLFGESFSPKEVVGAVLIVVGTAVAWA
ncbi:MAG: hypothetical protein AAF409_02330 [Pseudomonadota bacterium]